MRDTDGLVAEAFVSILVLTHNAPDYVRLTIESVRKLTRDVNYEIVVVDNASEEPTREIVQQFRDEGKIDKLFLSPENTLFAKGNNIAASLASPSATHLLLLNSDIEVLDGMWLKNMLAVHRSGVTACQIHHHPRRVDGWCFLIDAPLYQKHQLDEKHQWWWSVTKLQAMVLNEGLTVQGIKEYKHFITHFGGKSGDAFKAAQGMDVPQSESAGWFNGRKVTKVAI